MSPRDNNCPACGVGALDREEVDIGVGVQCGPWYCPDCGWAEDTNMHGFDFDDDPHFVEEE